MAIANDKTHHGGCFCGAVRISVSGQPAGMGYCHCESCRSWSAGPVNAFTLWQPDAVRVTQSPSCNSPAVSPPPEATLWNWPASSRKASRNAPGGHR